MKIINLINKKYNEWLGEQVKYYRNKYKFADEATPHNNKSGTFKHAFSSAKLTMWLSPVVSKIIIDKHEQNNLKKGAPVEESIMGLHNNDVGRKIGCKPSLWFKNDKLAEVIVSSFDKMICSLDDDRIEAEKDKYPMLKNYLN